MSVIDLIERLGKQESSLTERTFVSPIFNNTSVATRVEGLIYTFSIPRQKGGWYHIRPFDSKRARVVGEASLSEIETYLKCLGKVRIVLVMKQNGVFMGIPDKANNYGLSERDLLPVLLCDDAPLDFDRVIARYDGANLWYECVDQGNDPSKGDYLRNSMAKVVLPPKIKFSGLTLEEKQAYALRLVFDKKLVEGQKKSTLQQDVEFAGGKFVRFEEKSDHFAVTYMVEGQQFTSRITKELNRMVLSAGLCLNGNDRRFDLKSLITVIREAQHRRIVHVGDYAPQDRGYDDDEDDY
ncbi:MAG: hypothetical protein IMZ64_13190 [Bacteroidetes bacterium]|nr:hypothetical protein [Bacteroidota bacterium]